jgi:hypothetical protein
LKIDLFFFARSGPYGPLAGGGGICRILSFISDGAFTGNDQDEQFSQKERRRYDAQKRFQCRGHGFNVSGFYGYCCDGALCAAVTANAADNAA